MEQQQKKHVALAELQLIVGMALAGAHRDTVLMPGLQPAGDGVANWQPLVAPRSPGDQAVMEQLRQQYEVLGWVGKKPG